MSRITVIAIVSASILASSCSWAAKEIRTATVEELAKSPEAFNGSEVQVHACASSNMHATTIFDCATPDGPLVVLLVPDESRSKDALELITESFGWEVADGHRRVSASIRGHFQWRPNERPQTLLVLKSISDLVIANEP